MYLSTYFVTAILDLSKDEHVISVETGCNLALSYVGCSAASLVDTAHIHHLKYVQILYVVK